MVYFLVALRLCRENCRTFVLSSSQKETITLKRGGEKGLGFSIAGGRGSTPYKDGDSVSWFTSLRDKCVLGQSWVQDGWVLARLFFAFLWTESETKSRFIKDHKNAIKSDFNTQSSSANKFVNKGFSYRTNGRNFSCGTNAKNPERAR